MQVVVERVFPFGVFGRLPDGSDAYIRRRQFSHDPDIDTVTGVVEGDRFEAVVTRLPEEGKCLEVSRAAALPDIWRDFAKRYQPGDVVHGVVTRVRPQGVRVRLATGVLGWVSSTELTSWQIDSPHDLLWLGDEVRAVIMSLDSSERRAKLSIRRYLKQRETVTAAIQYQAEQAQVLPALEEVEPEAGLTPEERDHLGRILA